MKRNHMNIFPALFMLAGSVTLFAQPGTITSHRENSQLVKDLSGYEWKFKQMHPGQGVKIGLQELPPADIETLVWNPAQVPGDVYTDLWKAGIIDDPYYGRNSTKAQWVMNEELSHGGDPSMRWQLSNVELFVNAEGLYKPDKGKSRNKIDIIAALINAIHELMRQEEQITDISQMMQ